MSLGHACKLRERGAAYEMIRRSALVKWPVVFYGSLLKILFDFSFAWALQGDWPLQFPLSPSFLRSVISAFSIIILLSALPNKKDASSFFTAVLLLVIVMPMSTVYAFMSGDHIYYNLVWISFLCIEVALIRFDKTPQIDSKRISLWIRIVFILVTITTIVWLFIELGMPTLTALNYLSVYKLRASNEISVHIARLSRISATAIIPILLTEAVLNRRYLNSIALGIAQLLIYLWLGHKVYLFAFPLIFLSVLLTKKASQDRILLRTLQAMLAVIAILSIGEILSSRGILHGKMEATAQRGYSLIVRRSFFVPAYLRFKYFDYFVLAGKPLIGMLGTFLSPILLRLGVADPYAGSSYSYAVGIWMGTGGNANTGVFGGELAVFGVWGIPVAAFSVFILLMCVRAGEKKNGFSFTVTSSIFAMLYLLNAKAIDLFGYSSLTVLAVALLFYRPVLPQTTKTAKGTDYP